MNPIKPSILLTIDVEDWFQVENFKQYIPFSAWPSCELRVEKNTHRLLDFLDSYNAQRTTDNGRGEKPRATFFVLGWIAERLPHLVLEIHSRGHEVASHGYRHDICDKESSEELKRDLSDSKKRLEDIIGVPVYGYRAPSFSINNDILKGIEECGYLYDSSYNSFSMHGRYGKLHLSKNGESGIAAKISDDFFELPISNINLLKSVLPWGGGSYFRLIPFPLFKIGIKFILGQKNAYLFYFHPWEIDPDQPRVGYASTIAKFRHYTNLDKTESKFLSFMQAFRECEFVTCHQYLKSSQLIVTDNE